MLLFLLIIAIPLILEITMHVMILLHAPGMPRKGISADDKGLMIGERVDWDKIVSITKMPIPRQKLGMILKKAQMDAVLMRMKGLAIARPNVLHHMYECCDGEKGMDLLVQHEDKGRMVYVWNHEGLEGYVKRYNSNLLK